MGKITFYTRRATQKRFGEIQGFNFGVGILTPPRLTAWCYYIDGLLIDTGISLLRNEAVKMRSSYKPEQIVLTHHHMVYCVHNPQLSGEKKCVRQKLDFLENFYGNVVELYRNGLSEKKILTLLDKGNDRFIKFLSGNNASFAHMVKSALKTITD